MRKDSLLSPRACSVNFETSASGGLSVSLLVGGLYGPLGGPSAGQPGAVTAHGGAGSRAAAVA